MHGRDLIKKHRFEITQRIIIGDTLEGDQKKLSGTRVEVD